MCIMQSCDAHAQQEHACSMTAKAYDAPVRGTVYAVCAATVPALQALGVLRAAGVQAVQYSCYLPICTLRLSASKSFGCTRPPGLRFALPSLHSSPLPLFACKAEHQKKDTMDSRVQLVESAVSHVVG